MKTPQQLVVDIERRLRSTWSSSLDVGEPAWPHTFALGAPRKAELETSFHHLQERALTLRSWASGHDLVITDATRRVHGTSQPVPTHVTVADVDSAAAVTGEQWLARLRRGRQRLAALRAHDFLGDLTRTVAAVDGYSDLDFALLCSTSAWFRDHGDSARGLTPRQVPVPGLQAKWLNSKHALIASLAGLPELGLARPHPPRIHFTYLDSAHRAAGGRWHDSASVGDVMTPAYRPAVVIISENKDTAVGFPPVPGGISVEGAGTGGSTPAAIDWLRTCPNIIYWGDMDAEGLTILNQYREAGLNVVSILMDIATFETYAEFGTDLDRHGNPVKVGKRHDLGMLTDHERRLYDRLTDPAWRGFRRLEQERIPFDVAVKALASARRPDCTP